MAPKRSQKHNYLGAAQRQLTTTAPLIVVDLEIADMALESFAPLGEDPSGSDQLVPFAEARGRVYWPHCSVA